MIDRRGFLKLFGMAAAAFAVAVPTAAQVFEVAQKTEEFKGVTLSDIDAELMRAYPRGAFDSMFRTEGAFRQALRRG